MMLGFGVLVDHMRQRFAAIYAAQDENREKNRAAKEAMAAVATPRALPENPAIVALRDRLAEIQRDRSMAIAYADRHQRDCDQNRNTAVKLGREMTEVEAAIEVLTQSDQEGDAAVAAWRAARERARAERLDHLIRTGDEA